MAGLDHIRLIERLERVDTRIIISNNFSCHIIYWQSYIITTVPTYTYRRSLCEETQQMQRSLLEIADFHRLPMRLFGVELQPGLKRFLEKIMETEG